jgi:hypothetical protein
MKQKASPWVGFQPQTSFGEGRFLAPFLHILSWGWHIGDNLKQPRIDW